MKQPASAASQPQKRLRTLNDRAFCELLAAHQGLTRKQLARSAGLSAPAATKIVSRLQSDGIVVLSGERSSGKPGPKADLIGLSEDFALATAVEVGQGRLRVQHHNLAHAQPGAVETVALDPHGDLAGQLSAALATGPGSGSFQQRAVCVAVPGVLDPATADVLQGTGLEQWTPGLSRRLSALLRHPCEFDNDVNLHAAAEHTTGAAQGLDDFLLVSYGRGVGAGVVMDGRVRRGTHGAAGELSLLPTQDGVPHFHDVVRAWLGRADGELPSNVDWARIVEESEPKDWTLVATAVGRALLAVALVVDPQAIVLAGDISLRGGERLRAPVQEYLETHLDWRTPDVLVSALENGAVLAGAALRARSRVFEEAFR